MRLALVRDLGRTPRAGERVPAAVVDVVADQLGVEADVFDDHAVRDETRREHALELAGPLGLGTVGQADYRAAIAAGAVAAPASATERGAPIVMAVVEHPKARRILVPRPALVERLSLAGRARARREAHRAPTRGLDVLTRAGLQARPIERAEGSDRTMVQLDRGSPRGPHAEEPRRHGRASAAPASDRGPRRAPPRGPRPVATARSRARRRR